MRNAQPTVSCPQCRREHPPESAYCNACGSPLISPTKFPFQELRVRSLFVWGLISIPISLLIVGIVVVAYDVDIGDPSVYTIAYQAWFYGTILLWVLWQLGRQRIDLGRLVGRISGDHAWGPTIGILVATAVFSIGTAQLVLYGLSFPVPKLIEEMLATDPFKKVPDSAYPAAYLVALVVSGVVVAPVIEELLFRGVILHRWCAKWSLGTAVIASSIFFGLAHEVDTLGAFVFGIVMALLYIRTRSLLVPIIAHMLNNGFVFGMGIMMEGVQSILGDTGSTPAPSVVELREGLWVFVVLIVVSTPFLARFLCKNWPHAGSIAPYFAGEPYAMHT